MRDLRKYTCSLERQIASFRREFGILDWTHYIFLIFFVREIDVLLNVSIE